MTREDELITKIEQGDADALNELVTAYYPEILRYCLWHAPNRNLAQDATQETFLKAIRYLNKYVHKGKFRAFLYQIAANTCIDMNRKKCVSDIPLNELSLNYSYEEKGYEEAQADMQLQYLIKTLPDELKELIILRFGQDLTIREIAAITNTPLRTVQSRLRSALKQLKKELGKGEKVEN